MNPSDVVVRVFLPAAWGKGQMTLACSKTLSISDLRKRCVHKLITERLQKTGSALPTTDTLAFQLGRKTSKSANTALIELETAVGDYLTTEDPIQLSLVDLSETEEVISCEISALRAFNGKYLASGAGGKVLAIKGSISTATTWHIIRVEPASSQSIQLDGEADGELMDLHNQQVGSSPDTESWYFKNALGDYLTSSPGGEVSTTSQRGSWSQWCIEENVFFRDVHGNYLTAHVNGRVMCDAKGDWGKFDTLGKVVEGYLKKNARTGWQRRYFVLSESRIRFWVHKKDYRAWKDHSQTENSLPKKGNENSKKLENKLKSKGEYLTSDIMKIQSDAKGLMLTVSLRDGGKENKFKRLQLKASTASEFVVWSDSLAEEIHHTNIITRTHSILSLLNKPSSSQEISRSRLSVSSSASIDFSSPRTSPKSPVSPKQKASLPPKTKRLEAANMLPSVDLSNLVEPSSSEGDAKSTKQIEIEKDNEQRYDRFKGDINSFRGMLTIQEKIEMLNELDAESHKLHGTLRALQIGVLKHERALVSSKLATDKALAQYKVQLRQLTATGDSRAADEVRLQARRTANACRRSSKENTKKVNKLRVRAQRLVSDIESITKQRDSCHRNLANMSSGLWQRNNDLRKELDVSSNARKDLQASYSLETAQWRALADKESKEERMRRALSQEQLAKLKDSVCKVKTLLQQFARERHLVKVEVERLKKEKVAAKLDGREVGEALALESTQHARSKRNCIKSWNEFKKEVLEMEQEEKTLETLIARCNTLWAQGPD